MRFPVSLMAALAMIALPAAASAATQCKDAKGKFIKCPPAATATAKPVTTTKTKATTTKATTTTKASAARCKDAKGKFIKCPPAATATAKPTTTTKATTTKSTTTTKATKPAKSSGNLTGRCRDAKGRFAKCGTPGTHPA